MDRCLNLSEILDKINQNGLFLSIRRFKYVPYDMKMALRVVEAIGKRRNKKFRIDEENRFTYENLIRWVHGDDKMQCIDPKTKNVMPGNLNSGIYIAGNTGTGKSWALEIMAAYCSVDSVAVEVGGKITQLKWPSFRTDAICDVYMTTGMLERFKNARVMAFQDLGSEPMESLYMGNRLNVMRQILENRGDRTDVITLITSNLPINCQEFTSMYGDRVASRLLEMCNYFEIKGTDRRKLK